MVDKTDAELIAAAARAVVAWHEAQSFAPSCVCTLRAVLESIPSDAYPDASADAALLDEFRAKQEQL